MTRSFEFKRSALCLSILMLLGSGSNAVEFNSDFLKIDGSDADLSRFSRADYTIPGTYLLDVVLNNQFLGRQSIKFVALAFPKSLLAVLASRRKLLANCRARMRVLASISKGSTAHRSGTSRAQRRSRSTSRRLRSNTAIPTTFRANVGAMG
jgi:outer membrane usher protein FimD/PapC